MSFPINPINGQTANINGVQYTYSSALTAWTVTSGGGSLTTAASVTASGNITSSGNISGTYLLGNIAFATGLVSSYGNSNVAAYLASGTDSSNIITTGNISGGNINGGANVYATIHTGGSVSVSGNVTGGNLTTAGLVSATGNVTGNNISYTTSLSTKAILETATIDAAAPTSTYNFDVITDAVIYSTASATTNFTLNIRGNSGVALNTLLATGQSTTVALLVTNGGTAYYPNVIQIDGAGVTPKYQNGIAISGGNTSAIDVYTFCILKTANATYTVLMSQTKFA